MKFRESPRSAVLAKLKLILTSSPEILGYVYNLGFTFNVRISYCFSLECSESNKLTKAFKADSQRAAFLVLISFSVYGGMV